MYIVDDSQNFDDPDYSHELSLSTKYEKLCGFVDGCISDFQGGESVSVYFTKRSQHRPSMGQDLMPLLVYEAVGGPADSSIITLAASWALNLAAAHFLDEAQDNGRFQKVNDGIMALGTANLALAQLDADEDTLRDILDAVGRVAALGTNAQNDELQNGRIWSEAEYFRNVAGKAAAIISTGVWMGGRLATTDAKTLDLLKEFG
ncbi:MAG: hypothetical protein GY805_25030, partial [Chloroflexi bacterium]|nr:hypothetical protein [Chloroflexota bacterium]